MTISDLERDKHVTHEVHRLFWRAMLKERYFLAVTYLFHLPAFFIFNILVPLQVAYGIQAIITRHFTVVPHQALTVVVVTLLGSAFFAVGTWTNHRVNVYGGTFVQRAVFSNYLSKDYDFYSSRYIGALGADAVTLRSAFQEYALLVTFDLHKAAMIIFAGLAVVIYKSLTLGLVTAGCVLLVLVVAIAISKLRLKYRRSVSQASSYLAGMIGDPLSHGPAVKSFAQEANEQQRLTQPIHIWQRAQLKIFDTSIPHSFVRHIMMAVTMAVLLLVSARLYKEGSISIAIVALVQLYVIRVVNTTIEVGEIIKRYESLMGDAYEPMATMLVPLSVQDKAQTVPITGKKTYEIKFNGMSYKYPETAKDNYAVRDFSLAIKPGEKIGLVGYSGGGKTTITKLLLRFMDVDTGAITIDGIDIRDIKQSELRTVVAYVPQEPLLFHRSIKENIAYARPDASHKDIEKAAKTAYVDEFVKDLPEGYGSMVGERGVKLSGGQRQRVAIARALLKDAPILVLDEATSALDSQSEQFIQKALWELMAGRTAIVIAHRLSTIQRLDRIVVMDKGKIIQIGSHNELLRDNKGIYAQLWTHQSGGYLT